jgi:hypothetical protein
VSLHRGACTVEPAQWSLPREPAQVVPAQWSLRLRMAPRRSGAAREAVGNRKESVLCAWATALTAVVPFASEGSHG